MISFPDWMSWRLRKFEAVKSLSLDVPEWVHVRIREIDTLVCEVGWVPLGAEVLFKIVINELYAENDGGEPWLETIRRK